MSNTSMTALHRNNVLQVRTHLESRQPELVKLAMSGVNVEQVTRIAVFECSKDEKLASCTQLSIYEAVAKACALGLVAGGGLSRAYLVPIWNKDLKAHECHLWIGYSGMMDLARRSGVVTSITSKVVYTNDHFEYEFRVQGEHLVHRPDLENPGNMRLVYACAQFKDGGQQLEIMTADQVNKIRNNSMGGGKSAPWMYHTDEMWRKTVIRRLCKYLPMTPEAQLALTDDINSEFGSVEALPANGQTIDVKAEAPSPAAATALNNAEGSRPPEPPPHDDNWAGGLPPLDHPY